MAMVLINLCHRTLLTAKMQYSHNLTIFNRALGSNSFPVDVALTGGVPLIGSFKTAIPKLLAFLAVLTYPIILLIDALTS